VPCVIPNPPPLELPLIPVHKGLVTELFIDNDVKIGQYTSIGDNSQLSKCDIENTIVMSNCCIKTNKKIRNSIISYNSSIVTTDEHNNEIIFLLGEGTKIIL